MTDRFQAVDKAPGGAQIRDTKEGRTVAIFLPKPGNSQSALVLARHAARAFNDWNEKLLAALDRKREQKLQER
jgi:hypothetical protein